MSKLATDTGILLETGTNELEILEFYINETIKEGHPPVKNHFGINVAKVMQVIETPNLEPPESAPHPSFMGTIPLRDLILPVLDLSVWLELNMPKTERDIVIVTEFSKSVTGFLVSGVTEIHRVGWGEVIPPSSVISQSTDSIIGLVDKGDHFIQLLDLETILTQFEPDDGIALKRSDREYKVLVADDSATIRTMLQQNLTSANFKPTITNNGSEALKTIMGYKAMAEEAGKDITEYVDIVVSDIEMPLMDGFSLTKNIKQDPVLKKLPVILYSSIITNELRHKGDSVGADMQITKPDLHTIPEVAIKLIEGTHA
ncbi:MAG: chemotaxis protein [Pseudodesulfovibrio sp.]|uniref:CheW domain protein n=1 Tax=Pseudodesulfovibrio aespoeensis (strain ATCC 700646 / DSM 10631 / Aspo-2) TaxID=643562 RepID=E6VU62_PSEA9|nr:MULTISPECIES: chemotaxis protein [Pseudodesulfovibrio]MBU4193274.1 chemotaxis protein [Pseudomonadota bacterium]ADU62255.1 CheW domain protein [Pseudodesulfovibrio aespoeensis Aspo-2]MBU4243305.1 chemotaxis protein [Pseudomonadota bacterium]MBU4380372.1 chemotaxis protein [Pseudomonadota bacterium]MBU4476617.1 chemotaxis protein [Pseudomonadota bacterium]